MQPDDTAALKRHVRHAAWRGGVPAMQEAGWQPPPDLSVKAGEEAETAVPRDLWVGALSHMLRERCYACCRPGNSRCLLQRTIAR